MTSLQDPVKQHRGTVPHIASSWANMGSIIQKIADEIELHGSMEAYEAWLEGKPFDELRVTSVSDLLLPFDSAQGDIKEKTS